MNILYLIPHLHNSGGMERVLCQKANWLATHTDHKITIATTELTPEGKAECFFPLDKSIRIEALHIDFDADFNTPLLRKYVRHTQKMRAYRQALCALVKREKTDLCISLGGKDLAFLPELPCRTMAELHFAKNERLLRIQAHHSGAFWTLLGKIRVRQMVREVGRLERFVVLTEADRKQWAEAGCTQATVIPNPCSLCGIELPETKREKEILAVGRLHPQKGLDRMLSAWSPVEKAYPEWRLTIVGEGPERGRLEAQIRQLGLKRATLAGAHEHIERDYCRASVLALSSRYEGLPLAMIEAMWCGTPCISMDCPHGPAELLQEGGGILVEDGNTEALSGALRRMIENPELRLEEGRRAQAFAQREFSETAIMNRWTALLNDAGTVR